MMSQLANLVNQRIQARTSEYSSHNDDLTMLSIVNDGMRAWSIVEPPVDS